MVKKALLIGALDTKGTENAYVKQCLEAMEIQVLLMDTGILDSPKIEADFTRQVVARAGGVELDDLVGRGDRGPAMEVMGRGAAILLSKLFSEGRFDGVMALGGSGGTFVACQAMRALPLGPPKVMVSTVAGGDVSAYVGVKDIVMIPSLVEVAGINRISREVFARAAGALAGMLTVQSVPGAEKPLIVASMFANTTPCVNAARAILEAAGFDVLVFHATGQGGKMMESLIETGRIAGVLDVTTTEWADELLGGVFSAGPARLEAAARGGIPAIVTPGCLDMVNFHAPETVPDKFKGRLFYRHNPNVTLMRTDAKESARLGVILAEKLNLSRGPLTVLIPRKAISMIAREGGPFYLPEADRALFDALKRNLRKDIPVVEMDVEINDPAFAARCAGELMKNLAAPKKP